MDTEKKEIFNDTSLSPLFFEQDNQNHALFIQKQGEEKLFSHTADALKYFNLATDLDLHNPDLFYQQGVALSKYGMEIKNKKFLLLANKKFKTALKLKPDFFLACQGLGNSLSFLGTMLGEHHFFLEAKKVYEQALTMVRGASSDKIAQLYWNYGKVMKEIALFSGEVFDLNGSLSAHAEASSHNEDLPISFWQDFGSISLKMGMQVNDIRLILKAINCYKNALGKSLSSFESWHYLAEALSTLYRLTHDEDHFCQANECFTNASKLHSHNKNLWIDWANLFLYSGKHLKDSKRLHSSLETCRKAYSYNRKEERLLTVCVEALSFLGAHFDRLDLIQEGQNKVTEAIKKMGVTPEILFSFGNTLFAFGKYFHDLDYFYQAIEKYQEGLSIDRTCHKLWFSLGHTYALVGKIENDSTLLERANKFFIRAINLQTDSNYYYAYGCSLANLGEITQDKNTLELSLIQFKQAFDLQKNAVYLHPEWLFQYALALDLAGDLFDDEKQYIKAIEILKRVLLLDPDFPDVHYKIALAYFHLGELTEESEVYKRGLSHFKIAYQENEENEQLLLDWALTLIHLGEITPSEEERLSLWQEAEYKLIQAVKLGETESYYHLACLYSLMRYYEKAMHFLEKGEQLDALPPLDELLEDSWLENLRQTELFRSFISSYTL